MSEPFHLDTLNAKALAKEYKTVAKQVKNKDDAVKEAALAKLLEDCRYLTDGGCILPLLEVITPKKKTLDFSLVALEALLKFLTTLPASGIAASAAEEGGGEEDESGEANSAAPVGRISEHPALDVINSIQRLSIESAEAATAAAAAAAEEEAGVPVEVPAPGLNALRVISDLIVYKDEVKKYKPPKVKKGETPPPPPKIYDSEVSIALRNVSLHVLYNLISALEASTGNQQLAASLSDVPGIISNLCDKVGSIVTILVPPKAVQTEADSEAADTECNVDAPDADEGEASEPTEEELAAAAEDAARQEHSYKTAMQECTWALGSLATLLRHNAHACQMFLASSAMAVLPKLVPIDISFVRPILMVMHALSLRCDVAVDEISGLQVVSEPVYLHILTGVAATASANLMTTTAAAEEGGDVDDGAETLDLTRDIMHLHTAVNTLIHMAQQQRIRSDLCVFSVEETPALLASLNHIVASPAIWDIARSHHRTASFVDRVCSLFGVIGLAAPELRECVCASGCVSTVLTILGSSAAVHPDDSEATLKLRRLCELSLMQLLTMEEASDVPASRWQLHCQNFTTDTQFFMSQTKATEETEAEPQADAFLRQMASLLEDSDEDSDLSNRAVRILAALLGSTTEPVTFARDVLHVSSTVTAALGNLCHNRGIAVVQSRTAAAAVKGDASGEGEGEGEGPDADADVDTNTGTDADGEGHEEIDHISAIVTVPSELAIPAEECLYHALSLAEVFLPLSQDHIESFATEGHLCTLSELVFATGRTSATTTTGPQASTGVMINELEVELKSPRQPLPGDPEVAPSVQLEVCVTPASVPANGALSMLLRPLLLDVLATIIECDGTVAGSGEKGDISFAVCRICADACVATLSTVVSYKVHSRTRCVHVENSGLSDLKVPVLDASLRCLAAIAACDAAGITTALTALAGYASVQDASESGLKFGAVSAFQAFLGDSSHSEDPLPCSFSPSAAAAPVAGEEGEELAAEPDAPMNLHDVWQTSTDTEWAVPVSLIDVVATPEEVISKMSSLCSQRSAWPIVTLLSPVVAVLTGPTCSAETAERALRAAAALCTQQSKMPAAAAEGEGDTKETQAAIFDVIDAIFIALGGLTAIASAASAYGTIPEAQREFAVELATFLARRGRAMPAVVLATALKSEGADEGEDVEQENEEPATLDVTGVWSLLLDMYSDDMHQRDSDSTALLSAIRGGLPTIACCLVDEGADVNISGGSSPLSYALLLGQGDTVNALIAAGANVNAVDNNGNAAVKYAFASIGEDHIRRLPALARSSGDVSEPLQFLGAPKHIELLIAAGADLLASDREGNSATHYCVGLGTLDVSLGGLRCNISSGAYIAEDVVPQDRICEIVQKLVSQGNADVNASNVKGTTAMHIAVARGHLELMALLVRLGGCPNAVDSEGFLPVHHAAARCPPRVVEVINAIISYGLYNPTRTCTLDATRAALPDVAARTTYDIERALDDVFSQAIAPVSITEKRESFESLVPATTADGMNLLNLLMAGGALQAGSTATDAQVAGAGSKEARVTAVISLLSQWMDVAGTGTGTGTDSTTTKANAVADMLLQCVSANGLTAMHAAALMLSGRSQSVELTDAQRRSKRVKTYESPELHVLALLEASVPLSANTSICTAAVPGLSVLDGEWTPLMAAIANNNQSLREKLMSAGNFDQHAAELVRLITASQSVVNENTAREVLAALGTSLTTLTPSPLQSAVDNGNISAIKLLAELPSTDVNVIGTDGASLIASVAVEGVKSADFSVLDAMSVAAGRFDLSAGSINAIDAALDVSNGALLKRLLSWRKNDVLERIISGNKLSQLEEENMRLCAKLGVRQPPAAEKEADAADGEEVPEDGVAETKSDDDGAAAPSEEGEKAATAAADAPTALTDDERSVLQQQLSMSDDVLQLLMSSGITDIVDDDFHVPHFLKSFAVVMERM